MNKIIKICELRRYFLMFEKKRKMFIFNYFEKKKDQFATLFLK